MRGANIMISSDGARRFLWRLGRNLYCRARGEIANNLTSNGETYVQACAFEAVGSSGEHSFIVFDIGANFGEWTKALLQQMPSSPRNEKEARLFLFEPVPSTFEKLCANLIRMDRNGLTKAFNLALSNESGKAEMVVLSETGGTNSLHFDRHLGEAALNWVQVEKTTLVTFCAEQGIDHIHLLKCDTEGHDAKVLQGGKRLFETGRIDVAQFEYNHRWVYARHYLKDVFDLIDGLPYRIARICPRHIEVFEGWHFELERFFEANYLIVHERALDWFDVRFGTFDISNTYAC